MNIEDKFEDKLETIIQELRKISKVKFTGKISLVLNMSEGGIGQMAMHSEFNLEKHSKTQP